MLTLFTRRHIFLNLHDLVYSVEHKRRLLEKVQAAHFHTTKASEDQGYHYKSSPNELCAIFF